LTFDISVEDGIMHRKINAKYITELFKKHNTCVLENAFDKENLDYFVIDNKRDYNKFSTTERSFIVLCVNKGLGRSLYKGIFNDKEQFIIVETFLKP
jgi:hypothetical protein